MASAVAWRLYMANIRRICMTELDAPLCVRRTVSFCTAIEDGGTQVEGVEACVARTLAEVKSAWCEGRIAVVGHSQWDSIADLAPGIVVDAILAKRNLGTKITDAPLVIALGPGFVAGRDCHFVIETNRGHHLGRIVTEGGARAQHRCPRRYRRPYRSPRAAFAWRWLCSRATGELVTASRAAISSDESGRRRSSPRSAAFCGVSFDQARRFPQA